MTEISADIERMPDATPRQRALKLISALDEIAGPNRVLNGALKVAIIAQANGLKKNMLQNIDHWIKRNKDDLAKAEKRRQEIEAWPDEGYEEPK